MASAEPIPRTATTTVEAFPSGVAAMTLDGAGGIVSWSEAAARMFGFPAEEVIGRPATMLLADGERRRAAASMRRLLAGEPVAEVYSARSRDGCSIELYVAASPLADDAGVPFGVAALGVDLAPLRRAEQMLRQSEQRFRSLSDASPAGIFVSDPSGACTYTNPSLQALAAFEPEEALGDGWLRFVHGDDRESVLSAWRHAVEDRERFSTMVRLLRSDGGIVHVTVQAAPIHADDGSFLGMAGMVIDLTDQRRIQHRLADSLEAEQAARARVEAARSEIESVLESMGDALIACDHEWRVQVLNRAAEEVYAAFGMPRDRIVGRNLWDVFPDAVGTPFYDEYLRVARERTPSVIEDFYEPFGRWFEVRTYPRQGGVAIYFRDITERKRFEQLLEARARQQEMIASLQRHALAGGTVPAVCRVAAEDVARVLGVPFADVMLASRSRLACVAATGWREPVRDISLQARPRPQPLAAFWSREPVVVEDVGAPDAPPPTGAMRSHEVRSSVTVPIEGPDEPLGVLTVCRCEQRAFSGEEVEFLRAVATTLSLASQRARSEERVQRTIRRLSALNQERRDLLARLVHAREAERQRIARWIHDDPIQVMSAMVIRLQALERRMDGDAAQVTAIRDTAQEAVSRLRTLVFSLQPALLESEGLVPAIRAMLTTMGAERQTVCRLRSPASMEPPLDVALTLFRIAHEAVGNALKHAGAGRLGVDLLRRRGGYLLRVSDDGAGFDVAAPRQPGHLGLAAMRDDAEAVGGHVRVRSRPGWGTTVECWLPASTAPRVADR